jgi:hypothetical protein
MEVAMNSKFVSQILLVALFACTKTAVAAESKTEQGPWEITVECSAGKGFDGKMIGSFKFNVGDEDRNPKLDHTIVRRGYVKQERVREILTKDGTLYTLTIGEVFERNANLQAYGGWGVTNFDAAMEIRASVLGSFKFNASETQNGNSVTLNSTDGYLSCRIDSFQSSRLHN